MTADAGTGFKAEPSDFRTAGRAFTQARTRVDEIKTALTSEIGSLGECWGNDDIGNGFATSYKPNRDKVIEALGKLATVLGEIGTALDSTATEYQKVEDRNTQALRTDA